MNFKKIHMVFLLLFLFVFTGCLKDEKDIIVVPPPVYNTGEEIIHYLEKEGDFINSADCPAIVEAEEVYSNMHSYLIVDVRRYEDYLDGHIETAKNVQPVDLLTFFDSKNLQDYPKIIIVSKNGQSSSYYSALLRFYGIKKVYSMNYGMAAWNSKFAIDWMDALEPFPEPSMLSTAPFPKARLNPLPVVQYSKSKLSIKEKIRERVIEVLKDGFPEEKKLYYIKYASIHRDVLTQVVKNYNYYLICLGNNDSYYYFDRDFTMGHLRDAVLYFGPSNSDFKSNLYLQTVPNNRPIFIYSNDGNLSAYFTAYLRLIGYNAVSLLFGLNTVYPELIGKVPTLKKFAFSFEKIKNYKFSQGELL